MLGDGGQQPSPYPRHPVQPLETAERATSSPVGNDAFREAGPDSREPGNVFRACPVDIDPLTRAQWTGQGHRAVFVSKRRLGREGLDQLDFSRGLAGTRDHEPHGVTGHRKAKQ